MVAAALGCVATLITGMWRALVQQVTTRPASHGSSPTGTVGGEPVPIVDGYPITLSLTDEGAGGTAACNGYGGMYEIAGAQITFSELLGTAMACVARRRDGIGAVISGGSYW